MTPLAAIDPHPLASGRFVVVEQLSQGVWCPRHPGDGIPRAADSYVTSLGYGLWMAMRDGLGVVTVDEAGRITLMAHPPGPGAQW